MKKFVIATMIAACIALCTAVWLHGNAVGETPVPATKTAVSAKKATVVETESDCRGNNRKEFRVTDRDGKRDFAARSISRGTS